MFRSIVRLGRPIRAFATDSKDLAAPPLLGSFETPVHAYLRDLKADLKADIHSEIESLYSRLDAKINNLYFLIGGCSVIVAAAELSGYRIEMKQA